MKKKVLIIGGSSDIGQELAKKYLGKEYVLHLHYNKNFNILKNFKKNFSLIKADLSSSNLNKILKKFDNDYDIIINLAGYVSNQSFQNFNTKTLEKTLRVNSIIPLLIIRKSIKKMLKKKWGRITNSSSVGIKFGGGNSSFEYSLSKHFNEFIPNFMRQLPKKNIFYNVVRIGLTDTKIHKKMKNKDLKTRAKLVPTKRMADPKDIAEYIFYISSAKNTFITSEIVNITGGE